MTFNPAAQYSPSASLRRGFCLAESTKMELGINELAMLCRGVLVDMGELTDMNVTRSPDPRTCVDTPPPTAPQLRKLAPKRKTTKKKRKSTKKKASKKKRTKKA